MSTISTEDLANSIKGLGPSKADLIKNHIENENEVTVQSLSAIRGVSASLAKRVVAYLETHVEPEATETDEGEWDDVDGIEWDQPEPATADVETNGHVTRTAGEIRQLAREIETFGYNDVANELRTRVYALMDDETADV